MRVQAPASGAASQAMDLNGNPIVPASGDEVTLPEDWSRTKQKTAQLMFQVPRVVAMPRNPVSEGAAPIFSAAINHTLKEVSAAHMVDECLADVINACGICVSVVGYETSTRTVDIPQPNQADGSPTPPKSMPEIVAARYTMNRLSLADFLWPAEFRVSNWDKSPWLGYKTYVPTETVKNNPKWKEKLGDGFVGGMSGAPGGLLHHLAEDLLPVEMREQASADYTGVTVVWYNRKFLDPTAHPDELWTIVFVDGHDEPVEDAPTLWQKWVPADANGPGRYLGITKKPIRVETLVYVSDMAVPPSDSEAGRPSVREQMRARSQMLRQRDHAIPIRWYDTNRIDEEVAEQLKNGTWQDMIPMNGPGDRAIGEVARASYPKENWEFLNISKSELDSAWSLSRNGQGQMNTGRRSAEEVKTAQGATDTRLAYEKNRIERFILGNVEVLAGLMQMFHTQTDYVLLVGQDGVQRLSEWNAAKIPGQFAFELVPDSSEHLDIDVRIARALKLYNLAANSPSIRRQAIEKELIELMGFDPAKVQMEPTPGTDKPNWSQRLDGADLMNPIALAIMLKSSGIKLLPEEIAEAQKIILSASTPAPTAVAAPPPPAQPGNPEMVPPTQPAGAPAQVTPPNTSEPILKRAEGGARLMGE